MVFRYNLHFDSKVGDKTHKPVDGEASEPSAEHGGDLGLVDPKFPGSLLLGQVMPLY